MGEGRAVPDDLSVLLAARVTLLSSSGVLENQAVIASACKSRESSSLQFLSSKLSLKSTQAMARRAIERLFRKLQKASRITAGGIGGSHVSDLGWRRQGFSTGIATAASPRDAIQIRPGNPGGLITVIPFPSERVAKIESIAGRRWHPQEKAWIVPPRMGRSLSGASH